ncbi:chitinase-3-like protein 1 isoform X1 [Eriocheir sinensis]|uniref:chitinase-3-like protein 1 isoform X1 n=1 Tax=Eriocheir sinensis TaxID=95602 RepID=UPI0021CA3FCB|nr:chitinase-3-like protein 1 isoform X1 [Eriocheir sinensis]
MAGRLWLVPAAMALLLPSSCWGETSAPPPTTSRTASVSASTRSSEHPPAKKLLCLYSLPCPGLHARPSALLPPSALDSSLCTHIVISSALLHNTTIVPCSPGDTEVYKKVVALKKKNPSLQVMVRVEGNWTALTRDRLAVAVFAYNAQQFLQKMGLGGLELSWQPPALPPWGKSTAHQLSLLLLQLNNAIKLASHPPLLFSMVVSASQKVIDSVYDMKVLNQTVDFVSVATYDFHIYESYLPFTGHGAPLQAREAEKGYWATLNTRWAAKYWLSKGLPREKLVVTIPSFANTWTLLSSGWNKVGAPAVGLGIMQGHMTYPKVCGFLQGSGQRWDKASRVPYAWRSREWVSYENEASVKEKAELVIAEHIGGVSLLDLNSDDWAGQCPGATTFPLLRAVKEVLSRPGV